MQKDVQKHRARQKPNAKQKMKQQTRPTRRSMTFSGCFTCRARGVKCDEQRPACQRCAKAKRVCGGYGVRLIWEDRQKNKNAKAGLRSERRSLPWAYGQPGPGDKPGPAALRDEELDAIIEGLPDDRDEKDAQAEACRHACPHPSPQCRHARCHPHASLFTVFVATPPLPPPPPSQPQQPAFPVRARMPAPSSPSLSLPFDDDLRNLYDLTTIPGADSSFSPDLDILPDLDSICDLGSIFGPPPALGPEWGPEQEPEQEAEQWRSVMESCSPSGPGYQDNPYGSSAATVMQLCASPQPTEESRLLDHWVRHTSNIMIPMPRQDNPFRTIFVPMALVAQSQLVPPSEHMALLHGIYAVTAFNCAQQQQLRQPRASSRYSSLGWSHHQLCLAHLQRSLRGASSPEAVLATIILNIVTHCFVGDSTAWRAHVRMGRQWLQAPASRPWRTQPAGSTLHQIFLILEAIGTASHMPSPQDSSSLSLLSPPAVDVDVDVGPDSHENDYTYNNIFGLSCTALYHNYQLDSLYGISQPMFEAIVHINRLGGRSSPPSQQELENLRVKILLNDPRALRVGRHHHAAAAAADDDTERRFVRHHAYVFYFACRIHYERVLFHVAPHAIQHLVRCALDHLEAIANLETNLNVAGLMWPVFVIACEADDPGLQKRASWYFDKGQKYGICSISSAHRVLSEVWRRRRMVSSEDRADVSWQKVMADSGIDFLLT